MGALGPGRSYGRLVTVLTVVHVLAAILFVGPSVVATSAAARALRGGRDQLPVARWLLRTSTVYSLGTLVVIALGMALVPVAGYSYGDAWLSASMTLSVVAVVVVLAAVLPSLRSGISAVESGQGADGVAGRVAALSGVAALAWVAVLVLMYWQPGG